MKKRHAVQELKDKKRFSALKHRMVLIEGHYHPDQQGGFLWKTDRIFWAWASVVSVQQVPATLGFSMHPRGATGAPLVRSTVYHILIRGDMEKAQKIAQIRWHHKTLRVSGAEIASEAGYVVLQAVLSDIGNTQAF